MTFKINSIQRVKRKAMLITSHGTYTITGNEKYLDSEIERFKKMDGSPFTGKEKNNG